MGHLHIDADRYAYAIGFACQKKDEEGNLVVEPIENALHSVKVSLQKIADTVPVHSGYTVYLTGKGNFREDLVDYYKENRKGTEKPVLWQAIRDYLIKYQDAVLIEGMEADDACSLALTNDPEAICVSNDKDLWTVPGWHINPTKDPLSLELVTEEDALRLFYTQILWGDTVDNIKGLPYCADTACEEYKLHHSAKKGCGKTSAVKILADCETEIEMYEACLQAYFEYEKQELSGVMTETVEEGWEGLCMKGAEASLLENAQLLHMTRELNDKGEPVLWTPPL